MPYPPPYRFRRDRDPPQVRSSRPTSRKRTRDRQPNRRARSTKDTLSSLSDPLALEYVESPRLDRRAAIPRNDPPILRIQPECPLDRARPGTADLFPSADQTGYKRRSKRWFDRRRGSSDGGHDEDLADVPDGPTATQYAISSAIGRESGPAALSRDESWLAAKRRNDIDASAVALGTKRDPASVRRERRFGFICRITRQPHSLAGRELLPPDVQIACSRAVRCVRDQLAVRRKRRIGRQARIRRQPREAWRWSRRRRACEPPRQSRCGRKQDQTDDRRGDMPTRCARRHWSRRWRRRVPHQTQLKREIARRLIAVLRAPSRGNAGRSARPAATPP